MDKRRLTGLLEAIRSARASGSAIGLKAYENIGQPLDAHVRDATGAKGKRSLASALATLEDLVREFLADDASKLRKDVNEIAHRVMLEVTGQAPKTPPPGERSEDEKNPEAVARGQKGGETRD